MLSPAVTQEGNFTVAPDDQIVTENASLGVECTYPGALFIVWRRNGQVILDSNPHFNISDSDSLGSSELSFARANHSLHTGDYQCAAVLHGAPNVFTNFSITVKCEFTVSHSDTCTCNME